MPNRTFLSSLSPKISSIWLMIGMFLIIGTVFRAIQPGAYIFGFDQVQILSNAEKITHGDIALIGPRTGPAPLFTGPLIYYTTAVWLMLWDSPYAVVVNSVVLAAATGSALALLGRRYLRTEQAVIMTALWALSPMLILFDRTAWNPNFILLASSLTFFPLLKLVRREGWQIWDSLLLAGGVFLGFQAHFSGLFLPILIGLTMLATKQWRWQVVLAAALGLGASLLPALVFDLRNNWLHLNGLLSIVHSDSIDKVSYWKQLSNTLMFSFENLGYLFGLGLSKLQIQVLGAGLGTWITIRLWQSLTREGKQATDQDRETWFATSWILVIAASFAAYRSPLSGYYLYIHLPAMLLLSTLLWESVVQTWRKFSSLTTIGIGLSVGAVAYSATLFPLYIKPYQALGDQVALAQYLRTLAERGGISQLSLDMPEINKVGLTFLAKLESLPLSNTGRHLHVGPMTDQWRGYTTAQDYYVWADPRQQKSETHAFIPLETAVVAYPKDLEVLQDFTWLEQYRGTKVFRIFADNIDTQDKLIIFPKKFDPFSDESKRYDALAAQLITVPETDSWTTINFEGRKVLAVKLEDTVLVYQPHQEITDSKTIHHWEKFSVHWLGPIPYKSVRNK